MMGYFSAKLIVIWANEVFLEIFLAKLLLASTVANLSSRYTHLSVISNLPQFMSSQKIQDKLLSIYYYSLADVNG